MSNITNNEKNNQQTSVVEAEVITGPVVSEQDFPAKSSRLESLIQQFRKDKNIPAPVQSKNPLANVKVKPGVKVKNFETLKPVEQQKVLGRVNGIDYTVSGDILNFGSAKESAMTKHAEVIISKYSAHEIDELSGPMTDLVAALKSNNPSAIVKGIGGKKKPEENKEVGLVETVREFFAMKKAREKMHKALAQRATIMQNLQELKIEMEKQKISLQQDIAVYEEMGRATFDQVNEFGLDCVALNLMIEDAQTKRDRMLKSDVVDQDGQPAVELDQEELYQAQNLQSAIERMQRRMYAITSVQTSTVQTIPMLAALIKGDEIICEKIDEVMSLIIPMWSWQYAIAIGAIKQQEALNLQKTIRGVTSQLLTGNAKMLHDNMIAAQEELYTAAVAIEDLQVVQDYIEDMVTTVQAKAKEASAKMMEGMKTMKQIEQRNYDLMAEPMLEDAAKNMMTDGTNT